MEEIKNKMIKSIEDYIDNKLSDKENIDDKNDMVDLKAILESISTTYNISYEELDEKYLKKKPSNTQCKLFDIINIRGKCCYVQSFEGGMIYDKKVNKIGEIRNKEYILYEQ